MNEQEKRFKPKSKNIEFQGLIGKDETYEFKEFHADKGGVIIIPEVIPEGWELAYLEGNTALYRRLKTKNAHIGSRLDIHRW